MTDQEFGNYVDKLEKKHSHYLKLAYLAAILQLDAELDETTYSAEKFDEFDGMLHGIGIDKKNLIFFDEAIKVFNLAAIAAFLQLPIGLQQRWHYNPLDERAIKTLLFDNARIASELTNSLKSTLTMLSSTTAAYTQGLSAVTRDIKQTLGLTAPQAKAVLNFRNQLETQKLLGFTSPQNRSMPEADRILLRDHMKNGSLTQFGIDRMVNKYYESLLNQRASEVATATVMNAINSGMNEMWLQGLTQGVFDSRDRKFWNTQLDNRVRPTHAVIPSMNPQGVAINSMFLTPHGLVPYPIWGMSGFYNCRCYVTLSRV